MTKAELISKVAESANITKKDADAAVSATFEEIVNALKSGDKVSLVGFGTFLVKDRAARECVNPATKQKMMVAASKVPSFKVSSALKDAIK